MSDAAVHTPIKDQVQQEYFGFQQNDKFYFPDGVTFIEFKVMNEGERVKYEKITQQDITVERNTGNARMRMNAGTQRHGLIQTCAVDWNLVRGGQLVPFTDRNLRDFLDLADPRLVDKLETAIRKANPFLIADLTTEEIDKQIEELQDMRKAAEERERGESS